MKAPILTPIDKTTWAMAQQFYYYTEMAPTTYTVNVTLDVTILRKTLKANDVKFFLLTSIWLQEQSANNKSYV